MQIIRGKATPAARRVVYGPPGVGKSTFACAEPGALALDYEDGLDHIGVDRVGKASTWIESLALVREACSGPGDHRAVVIDTLDKFESQAAAHICTVTGVEGKRGKTLADFGYQGGFKALAQVWRELLFALEGARDKGRSVTLVAHVQRTSIKDPHIGDHAGFIAAIHKDCWSTTHQWADAVLFATYERGMVEGRAITTGARVLYTVETTGVSAKHRPNIAPVLPLSWYAYAEAVRNASRTAVDVVASIRRLIKPNEKEGAEKTIAEVDGDVPRLIALETVLKKRLVTA